MKRKRLLVDGLLPLPERPAPTYPEYEQLLADAEASLRADGGFVDPAKLRRQTLLPRSWDWQVAVLGHDYPPNVLQMHVLLLAHDRDLDPPLPQWLLEARAAAAERREQLDATRKALDDADRAEWEAAVTGVAVEVEVLRNGHARPRHGQSHHLGHVVPKVDVVSGAARRPRRHRAGRALRESERRARPLDLSGGAGGPATCVSCLMYVKKIRVEEPS